MPQPNTLPARIERRIPAARQRFRRIAAAPGATVLAILSLDDAALSRFEAHRAYAGAPNLDVRALRIDRLV